MAFLGSSVARRPPFAALALVLACGLALGGVFFAGTEPVRAVMRCKAEDFAGLEAGVRAADAAFRRRDYGRVDDLARATIQKIGARYYDPESLDDSRPALE